MARVLLNVPLVGQKTGYDGSALMQPDARGSLRQHGFMACWYASVCMVAYYRFAGPRLGLPKVWADDQGLQIATLIAVPSVPSKWTETALADILSRCGPIWSAGYFLDGNPAAGH